MENNIKEVAEESVAIENSVLKFLSLWCERMPENAQVKDTETMNFCNHKEVVMQLSKQFVVSELTATLKERLAIHVLYAARYDGGNAYKAVGYSTPNEDGMYVVYVVSSQHGLADTVTVFFYDSVDDMYSHVRDEHIRAAGMNAEFMEMAKPSEVMSVFY